MRGSTKKKTGGLAASRMSMSKFKESDILEIRRLWDTDSMPTEAIAMKYGVGPETIRKIGRRNTFFWVKGEEELKEELREQAKRMAELSKSASLPEKPHNPFDDVPE